MCCQEILLPTENLGVCFITPRSRLLLEDTFTGLSSIYGIRSVMQDVCIVSVAAAGFSPLAFCSDGALRGLLTAQNKLLV